MKHLPHSSSASVGCRLEWRPSRWVILAILLAGLLAPLSILVSGMPAWAAWPLATLMLAHALWLARNEQRKPVRNVFFPGNDLTVKVDGEPVDQARVEWRGPLSFVSWKAVDGRRHRLSWWPETLPPARARELRLAANAMDTAPHRSAMAP